jgi:thiol:disulfide interchange protein DsbD
LTCGGVARPPVGADESTVEWKGIAMRTRSWIRLLGGVALVGWLGAAAAGTATSEEFLAPERAFALEAVRPDAGGVELRWVIAPGHHLYADRFAIGSEPPDARGIEVRLPKGERKFDAALGKEVEILEGQARVIVNWTPAHPPAALLVTSQGCADAGLCYPPTTQRVALGGGRAVVSEADAVTPITVGTAGGVGATSPAARAPAASPPATGTPTAASPEPDDASSIESLLRGGDRPRIALAFLAFGLLLAFTPCVLPMVPILSSIIAGDAGVTRLRGLGLAASYSLGMALVYTGMGVAAGLAGEGLAAALQKPPVLIGFALLLVALALSMFDVYQLQLPASVQSKLGDVSGRFRAGRASGVFLMGAVSALIVGPCVAAPLAGALVYISQTRNVVTGGLALFSMACGMSVPLLLAGVSAGSLLPRAGAWMNAVKRFFGVMLLATAIWMASPALPAWVQMLAWAALAIGCAMQLSVLDPLPAQAGGWPRLGKAIGVLALVAGVAQLVGLASGGRDPLQPLQHLAAASRGATASSGAGTLAAGARFRRVTAGDALARALEASSRPVVLDVYADWCTSCKEMEHLTFSDPRVARALERFTLLQVDVTANSETDRAFLKRFGLFGPPGVLVVDSAGNEHRPARTVGFVPPEQFLAKIEQWPI